MAGESANIGASHVLEAMAAWTARGYGAIELAIADRLARIERVSGFVQLGHTSLGDYAREELDIGATRGYELAGLARDLWQTQELRAAVHAGALGLAEAARRIAAARDPEAVPRDAQERWQRLVLALTPQQAHVLETTLEVAGLVSQRGLASSRWERLEHVFQDFLGEYGAPEVVPAEPREAAPASAPAAGPAPEQAHGTIDLDALRRLGGSDAAILAELAEELQRQQDLTRLDPPPDGHTRIRPVSLDRELRELARMRAGWDELFGRLCALLRGRGAWRVLGIHRWEDYCAARLGVGERTVRKCIQLEHQLRRHPVLRAALRSGRLGVEKAREIAFSRSAETIEQRIEAATARTVIELRRHLDGEAQRKISGTGLLEVALPERVDELRRAAFASAREAAGRALTPGECLLAICLHFLDTWADEAIVRLSRLHPVRRRDGCLCQAPGCSRPGEHVHHMLLASHGGSDARDNLLTLCPGHHLKVVHCGYLIVEGRAPDAVVWRVGPELARLREEDAAGRAA